MDELIKSYFNKNLYKITIDDIQEFFTEERDENDLLEFKAGSLTDFDKINKEVAAFLNTNGGILFIGTPLEKIKEVGDSKIKICKGELVLSKWKSKEQILQKILTGIAPPPHNIKVHEILTSEGNFFIVAVAPSMNPPHQVLKSGVYYIRMERDSRPASHGLVEALFLKRQIPDLTVDATVTPVPYDHKKEVEYKLDIDCIIRNDSVYPADRFSVNIMIDNINTDYVHNGVVKNSDTGITFSQYIEESLVYGLNKTYNFSFLHWKAPFMLTKMIWSKESPLKVEYVIFDPVNFQVLEKVDKEVNNPFDQLHLHLIDNLENIYLEIFDDITTFGSNYQASLKYALLKLPFQLLDGNSFQKDEIYYYLDDDNYFKITYNKNAVVLKNIEIAIMIKGKNVMNKTLLPGRDF